MPDDPYWRKVAIPDYQTGAYEEAWLNILLARLQANSLDELFAREFKAIHTRNRAIVFHIIRSGRSFAYLELRRRPATWMEHAYVDQNQRYYGTGEEAVTYAHEFMHLYGADDLYNKVEEPGIFPSELMKYGSTFLQGCLLSAITRYAIGWRVEPPPLANIHLQEALLRSKSRKGVSHE